MMQAQIDNYTCNTIWLRSEIFLLMLCTTFGVPDVHTLEQQFAQPVASESFVGMKQTEP